MRFTSIVFAGVFALASAQSTSTTVAPTTTDAATAAQNSQQAAIIACINACKDGDVACTSKCIAVPNPDSSAVNATNNCVADCPRGNGTASDNLNYSNCVDGCIGKFYFTTTGTPSQPTGAAGGSDSGSGSGGASGKGDAASGSVSPTGTESQSATGTGGAAATSTSNAAGEAIRVAGSTAGFLGFLAAVLAL